MNAVNKKPFGKHEVKQALVDAGIELFAERGIRAVTIRDIAQLANVNSALISRHFGGKEGLVEAVVVELLDRFGSPSEFPITSGEQMLGSAVQSIIGSPEVMRVFAHIALEGNYAALSGMRSMYLKETIQQISKDQKAGKLKDNVDARVLLSSGFAMALGWVVFAQLLTDMSGLNKRNAKSLKADINKFWNEAIRA